MRSAATYHRRPRRGLSLHFVGHDRALPAVAATATEQSASFSDMTWFTSVSRQIYGLFVEDGALSLSICVWLLLVWFVLPPYVAYVSVRPLLG